MRLIAYRTSSHETLDIVPAPRSRRWMVETSHSFANRCLPLLVANEGGWCLLNRDGCTVTWTGGTRTTDLSIVFDDVGAAHRLGPVSGFGNGVLSWPIPFLFRTEPGWDLLVRGVPNLPKDCAAPLEGLVETDWAEVTFTMNWKLTRAGHPVRVEAGEPFGMVVPQRREDLEAVEPEVRSIREEAGLAGRLAAWAAQRKDRQVRQFIAENIPHLAEEPEWDATYMRGMTGDGRVEPAHRVRRALKPFARD